MDIEKVVFTYNEKPFSLKKEGNCVVSDNMYEP